MPKLPRLTGTELLKALQRLGFSVVRVKGSHHIMKSDDGRRTVVPIHSGETIGPGLLSKILDEAEVTVEELISVL